VWKSLAIRSNSTVGFKGDSQPCNYFYTHGHHINQKSKIVGIKNHTDINRRISLMVKLYNQLMEANSKDPKIEARILGSELDSNNLSRSSSVLSYSIFPPCPRTMSPPALPSELLSKSLVTFLHQEGYQSRSPFQWGIQPSF
jgi:hypothetical protein